MRDWQPRLVALDIDGTLLKWVEGTGQNYEQISPVLYDAVQSRAPTPAPTSCSPAVARPHGMTKIADLLDLPREGDERLWVVASNGAVIFRYPPLEVVHEETFDASEAVRQVLEQHPEALVAVEERGVGYRVNRPFPDGELSGEMIETELDEIVGGPVSRVIIRDPTRLGRGLRRDGRQPRPARHRLRRRLDGLARPRTGRASPRPRGWSTSPTSSASTRPTCSPSATAATTSRCCAGPAAAWRWARRSRRSTTAADAITDTVYDDGAAVELRRWFRDGP